MKKINPIFSWIITAIVLALYVPIISLRVDELLLNTDKTIIRSVLISLAVVFPACFIPLIIILLVERKWNNDGMGHLKAYISQSKTYSLIQKGTPSNLFEPGEYKEELNNADKIIASTNSYNKAMQESLLCLVGLVIGYFLSIYVFHGSFKATMFTCILTGLIYLLILIAAIIKLLFSMNKKYTFSKEKINAIKDFDLKNDDIKISEYKIYKQEVYMQMPFKNNKAYIVLTSKKIYFAILTEKEIYEIRDVFTKNKGEISRVCFLELEEFYQRIGLKTVDIKNMEFDEVLDTLAKNILYSDKKRAK